MTQPNDDSTVVALGAIPRPRLRVVRGTPNPRSAPPAAEPNAADPTGNTALVHGVYSAPFGFVLKALVNRESRSVPLVMDEADELAALARALDLVGGDGGFDARTTSVWQLEARIQLSGADEAEAAAARVRALEAELLERATAELPRGASLSQPLALERLPCASDALLFRLHGGADSGAALESAVYDAARAIAATLGHLSGVRPRVRVRRQRGARIRVRCRITFERLIGAVLAQTPGAASGADHAVYRATAALGAGAREAAVAAAHNAIIESGVAAVALALGNAPERVVAGAHRDGTPVEGCRPLCTWRVQDSAVLGELELPIVMATHGRWRAPTEHTLEDGAPHTAALDIGMLAACIGMAASVVALEDTLRVRIQEQRALPQTRRQRVQ